MKVVGVAVAVVLAGAAASASTGSAGAPSPVLVRFEQTGGFAGIERGLVVRRSGKVVSDGLPVSVSQLSRTRLAALRLALVRARWASLAARYESETPVADGFVYRVTYAGRTIRIEEHAKLPPRLARPFSLLAKLGGIAE